LNTGSAVWCSRGLRESSRSSNDCADQKNSRERTDLLHTFTSIAPNTVVNVWMLLGFGRTCAREGGELLILGKKKKAAVSAALVVPRWFFN
jgi:hypothetical protein